MYKRQAQCINDTVFIRILLVHVNRRIVILKMLHQVDCRETVIFQILHRIIRLSLIHISQEQIKEVVAYAASKYINVIPEIEMPGHALAALAAYPELSCDSTQTYKVSPTWGVFEQVFCPSETTFKFFEGVMDEVVELFPSEYIHIGGDECPKTAWKNSAFCQQLIRQLGLKDDVTPSKVDGMKHSKEDKLQSYFVTRMEKYLNGKGRNIIGWDEILEGGLAPNATVLSWRGVEGGLNAAKACLLYTSNAGHYTFRASIHVPPSASETSKERTGG